jgi:hypothetical protein
VAKVAPYHSSTCPIPVSITTMMTVYRTYKSRRRIGEQELADTRAARAAGTAAVLPPIYGQTAARQGCLSRSRSSS